jgi:hypothetical protein
VRVALRHEPAPSRGGQLTRLGVARAGVENVGEIELGPRELKPLLSRSEVGGGVSEPALCLRVIPQSRRDKTAHTTRAPGRPEKSH